jgi:hypothetical protein
MRQRLPVFCSSIKRQPPLPPKGALGTPGLKFGFSSTFNSPVADRDPDPENGASLVLPGLACGIDFQAE